MVSESAGPLIERTHWHMQTGAFFCLVSWGWVIFLCAGGVLFAGVFCLLVFAWCFFSFLSFAGNIQRAEHPSLNLPLPDAVAAHRKRNLECS